MKIKIYSTLGINPLIWTYTLFTNYLVSIHVLKHNYTFRERQNSVDKLHTFAQNKDAASSLRCCSQFRGHILFGDRQEQIQLSLIVVTIERRRHVEIQNCSNVKNLQTLKHAHAWCMFVDGEFILNGKDYRYRYIWNNPVTPLCFVWPCTHTANVGPYHRFAGCVWTNNLQEEQKALPSSGRDSLDTNPENVEWKNSKQSREATTIYTRGLATQPHHP